MAFNTITIAYSGSLDAYVPKKKRNFLDFLMQWFWTYKHDTVDSSTRSAYYLIKAVKILKEKHGIRHDQINFDFWGKIHPINKQQSEREGVAEYFNINAYIEKDKSLEKLKNADVLFLPLEMSNTPGIGTLFIPGKLFEYLNTGKPILALCENSDCKTILEASGLGICVNPNQPEQIADILLKIISDLSFLQTFKPDRDYISQFSFVNKTAELSEVFNKLNVK